ERTPRRLGTPPRNRSRCGDVARLGRCELGERATGARERGEPLLTHTKPPLRLAGRKRRGDLRPYGPRLPVPVGPASPTVRSHLWRRNSAALRVGPLSAARRGVAMGAAAKVHRRGRKPRVASWWHQRSERMTCPAVRCNSTIVASEVIMASKVGPPCARCTRRPDHDLEADGCDHARREAQRPPLVPARVIVLARARRPAPQRAGARSAERTTLAACITRSASSRYSFVPCCSRIHATYCRTLSSTGTRGSHPSDLIRVRSETVCRVSPTRKTPGTSGSRSLPNSLSTISANADTVTGRPPPTLNTPKLASSLSRARRLA